MNVRIFIVLTISIASGSVMIASSASARLQKQNSLPAMKHDIGPDMDAIHKMFSATDKIKRTVKLIHNGVETTTESHDPKLRSMIQRHVNAMHARLKSHIPIREWDPLFAELFKHADKIKLDMTRTKLGIKLTESSTDPYKVKLIQAHANAVSGFVKDGMAGMAKRHELPGSTPTKTAQFLGKGDGIKTCPVTGQPVDKRFKTQINGREIYFCCASCVSVVKNNPAAYLKTRP